MAVAARWRRGGRGGRACAAAAMVRKTKSELGFGNGGITTTSSGIGICRSDGNGDDDPGMVASPSPPPSSVVRGPGHCRGRVSGTTHSVPFSHQTNFLHLRQAEGHTPTITKKVAVAAHHRRDETDKISPPAAGRHTNTRDRRWRIWRRVAEGHPTQHRHRRIVFACGEPWIGLKTSTDKSW